MPFVANTPESLLGRSDSKNPSSTCRGITSNGRPCRRSVSPDGRARKSASLAPPSDGSFCWQHKNQALRSTQSNPGPRRHDQILEEAGERSSLDTLADRLGLVHLGDGIRRRAERRDSERRGDERRYGEGRYGDRRDSEGKYNERRDSERERPSQIECCFCFTIEEPASYQPHDRPQDRPERLPARPQPRPIQQGPTSIPVPAGRFGTSSRPHMHSAPASAAGGGGKSGRSQKSSKSPQPQTAAQYLDLIPPSTDPQTASSLMAELSRPYVDSEEAGYIYMFWMTPENKADPPGDAARSLLAPPPRDGQRSRRPSDVVAGFADTTSNSSSGRRKSKKMLLKIGRAANVQRRMNQWSRQCGYSVEVLRFYPYVPSASQLSGASGTPGGARAAGGSSYSSAADAAPRMTPHCHRVERLVHLELQGMGLRVAAEACSACGKEHREWFEVEATREGIRMVDEVIRRWVEWDEGVP